MIWKMFLMKQLKLLKKHTDIPIIPICASDGRGVKRVTKALRLFVDTLRKREERAAPSPDFASTLYERGYDKKKKTDPELMT